MCVCVYEKYYKEAGLSGRWCFFLSLHTSCWCWGFFSSIFPPLTAHKEDSLWECVYSRRLSKVTNGSKPNLLISVTHRPSLPVSHPLINGIHNAERKRTERRCGGGAKSSNEEADTGRWRWGKKGECIINIFPFLSGVLKFKEKKLDGRRRLLDKYQPSPAADEGINICQQRGRRRGKRSGGALSPVALRKKSIYVKSSSLFCLHSPRMQSH